ncbi:predicted GPI-anchored protein 58 [Dipodomys spectabilis]|uniref:predicted GPI-anchored protein 58 n=1 Tax=Dipodomys spectabilis TaxID=105255 RepID=UPI001C54659B|nr:predicted GPI-anchored protein 58 [Dipodomys spectabilis]
MVPQSRGPGPDLLLPCHWRQRGAETCSCPATGGRGERAPPLNKASTPAPALPAPRQPQGSSWVGTAPVLHSSSAVYLIFQFCAKKSTSLLPYHRPLWRLLPGGNRTLLHPGPAPQSGRCLRQPSAPSLPPPPDSSGLPGPPPATHTPKALQLPITPSGRKDGDGDTSSPYPHASDRDIGASDAGAGERRVPYAGASNPCSFLSSFMSIPPAPSAATPGFPG